MAYIMDMLRRALGRQPKPTNLQRASWLLHPYMDKLYGVLLWDNPMMSAWCLFTVNILFWYMRTANIHLLGVLGVALMVAAAIDGICYVFHSGKHSGNECANYQSANADRISVAYRETLQILLNFAESCRQYRQQKPLTYCARSVGGFVVFIILYHIFGALFTHGVVTLAFLSPLTPNLINKVNDIQSQPESDHEDEEFMPQLTNKEMEELNRAGEIQEVMDSFMTTGDLSLPPGENAALRYAAGEMESSDEDDAYTETKVGDKVSSLLFSDTSDSDSEFNIKVPDDEIDGNIKEKIVDSADMGWFRTYTPQVSSLFKTPIIQSDTDDDFEIIDSTEIDSAEK